MVTRQRNVKVLVNDAEAEGINLPPLAARLGSLADEEAAVTGDLEAAVNWQRRSLECLEMPQADAEAAGLRVPWNHEELLSDARKKLENLQARMEGRDPPHSKLSSDSDSDWSDECSDGDDWSSEDGAERLEAALVAKLEKL